MMFIKAMYDDIAAHLKPGIEGKCPMLRRIAEYLVQMKTENNGQIINEFRFGDDGEWDREC
jgi:hypothetical protein